MLLSVLGSHQILKSRKLQIASLQIEHGKNTKDKGMGLNVWNLALEAKYRIRLKHGKEDMSFTCKSLVSKLPHH
jgi:hypothetical protein